MTVTQHRHPIPLVHWMIIASCILSGVSLAQEHVHESDPATASRRAAPIRPAPSANQWTKTPVIVPAGKPENGNPVLGSMNSNAFELQVISPAKDNPLVKIDKTGGRWRVAPVERDVGGIHLLLAREASESETRLAMTTWMFHARAPSPSTLLAAARPGLVIQPLRVPEHGGFREGSTWQFQVRFDGIPVPGTRLAFDTENGSHATLIADDAGVANVKFPHDFDPASLDNTTAATRTRRSFSLGAELERSGTRHVSGFNHFYYPDPMRERNLLAGMGLFAFGMVLATPMLRRKKEKSHA